VIAPCVRKLVIANPIQVRVIAHAKIKTDTIDAGVSAALRQRACGRWVPDEATPALRRQVTVANQIVRHRSRLKNIQSILHSHLIPSCPYVDLCGAKAGFGSFSRSCPRTSCSPSNGTCASSTGLAWT
jgi:transposase